MTTAAIYTDDDNDDEAQTKDINDDELTSDNKKHENKNGEDESSMMTGIDTTDARLRQVILIFTNDLSPVLQGQHPFVPLTGNYAEFFQDSTWRPNLFTLATESSTTTPLVATHNVSSVQDAYLLQVYNQQRTRSCLLSTEDVFCAVETWMRDARSSCKSPAMDRNENCRDRARSHEDCPRSS